MRISIDHPTDRPNFYIVHVGNLSLAFSYRTIIGFSVGGSRWVIRENVWGPTTGKHLNYLANKNTRISEVDFTPRLHAVLLQFGLA